MENEKEEALLMFPDKTLLVSSGETLKKNMLDFLSKAQLPLYFDERELIREFIETFFKSLEKSNT